MKKKIWIPIVVGVLLMLILFVPIPCGVMKDGGTKEYVALTYKIVAWNRLLGAGDEKYSKTKVYFGGDYFKSIDELWEMEYEKNELWAAEYKNTGNFFIGTVLEINGNTAMVEPREGETVRNSANKIRFGIEKLDKDIKVGDVVKIIYDGQVMETYPAQINALKWEKAKDLRHKNYDGEWLDKKTATRTEGDYSVHVNITEIYADCFFARYVVPMPYTIKINGKLSDDWCVGDQVFVTFDNECSDDNGKQEGDLISIEQSDFEMEPGVAYKPVIYLYPEEKTEVSVKINLKGKLTCTYPKYEQGWKVTANPDGTLTDGKGQLYNYLYWEGETYEEWDMTKGFCVKGEDTAEFLEDALEKLGLNRKEANEFIVYWLPLMQENEYNIISFQTDVYIDCAKLDIEPKPDTLIRVFMAYKGSDKAINIEAQELTAPERAGFTVVEWGGSVVK